MLAKKNEVILIVNKNITTKKILYKYKIKNIIFHKNLYSTEKYNYLKNKYKNFRRIIIYDTYKLKNFLIKRDKFFFNRSGYIDDYGINLNSDFVINYSIDKNIYKYKAKEKILGLKYLPIIKKPFNSKSNIKKKILLTFGALDHYNLTNRLFLWFKKMNFNFNFIIIIGEYYKNIKSLKKFFNNYNNVKMVISSPNIEKYIKSADIVVCAGGMTVYEALYFRKKVISIQLWKNQKNTATKIKDKNLKIMKYQANNNQFLKNFEKSFYKLNNNLSSTKSISIKKIINNNMFINKILRYE